MKKKSALYFLVVNDPKPKASMTFKFYVRHFLLQQTQNYQHLPKVDQGNSIYSMSTKLSLISFLFCPF